MGIISNNKGYLSFISEKLQLKIALTYILIIIAVLVLLNTYPIIVSQDFIFKSKQSNLQAKANLIATAVSGLETVMPEGVLKVMEILDELGLGRIIVTDETGVAAFDNAGSENMFGKKVEIPEIKSGLDGNDAFRSIYENGAFLSHACVPVIFRGNIIGTVYVYEYDSEQGVLLEGIQSNIARISLVVSVIVIIISVIFSKALSARISSLLDAIRIVREGQYNYRVKIKGNDEIAELAAQFNDLTDRLQQTDEMRRRFVSDASHELKTPLASIRLLADSIKNTENIHEDVMQDFLSDISNEVDRLTRVTEELLALTRLDSKAQEPELLPVEIKQVMLRAAHMLRPLSEHFRVNMECKTEDGCIVLASEDGIYQILFNLIENAIKYTQQDGFVQIKLVKTGDKAVLSVSDTGMGIPKEDIPRIFERFYRVDKARSRQAGGTGLGLAIVYQSVKQFGGEISVESETGKGTTFVVAFPLYNI